MPKLHLTSEHGGLDTSIESILTGELRLDPDNVRFKHEDGVLKDDDMQQLIWDEPDTRTLYRTILASGGLSERPIITKELIVKEGNRRVVCLRRLSNAAHAGELEGVARDAFDSVDCEVLPVDVSKLDLDMYLARVHVVGKKPWEALNQAAHIYELYHDWDKSYESIREYLGIGKAEVIKRNKAYESTVSYLKENPGKGDIRHFSYFDELFRGSKTRQWAEAYPVNLKKFNAWLAAGKFNDSKQVRYIMDVLEDRDAVAVLNSEGGSMDEAIELLAEKKPAMRSQVFRTVVSATELLDNMPLNEYRRLADNDAQLDVLRALFRQLKNIFNDLSVDPDLNLEPTGGRDDSQTAPSVPPTSVR